MLNAIIEASLRNKFIVVLVTMAVAAAGIVSYRSLPTDAFPDISPVMVPVFTEAHGMAPEEVERFITIPIESALNGLPSVRELKSTSAFGMNVIYVYFDDGVDIYFARQLVAERLQSVAQDLPDLHEPPSLGPIATGLGEVFMYNLTISDAADTEGKPPLTYLREVNDWLVKYQLLTVPGITDVLSMGGHVLQYRIELDPYAMHAFEIGIEEVVAAVHRNNRNAGGQFLVLGSEEYLVRGVGLVESLDALGHVRVKTRDDVPVTLGQIGQVRYGNEIRRGAVTRNGEEEVVSGIVLKLMGENTSSVLEDLHEMIPTVRGALPSGVHFEPFYDQGQLVRRATSTIKNALAIGASLVVVTLLLFLGNVRSALIVASSLPLCAAVAFIGMGLTGMSANLMSLGGIAVAIGLLADGTIVMVENIHRHLSDPALGSRSKYAIIRDAATEVARPIVFSLSIVIVVFLPIFSLEGVERKMFSPMALTMVFAISGAVLAALIIAPTFSEFFLKRSSGSGEWIVRTIHRIYRPILTGAMRLRYAVLAAVLVAFGASLWLLTQLGTEFVPVLEEGTLVVGVNLAPSSSLEKNVQTIMKLERMLLEFDEVVGTVSKIGRPEAGGHPHPVNYALIQVSLKSRRQWRDHRSKEELVESMNERLGVFPGIQLNFTQPIQHLFDDLLTGVKSQLALKLYGPDLGVLESKAAEIKNTIEGIEGLVDLSTEQSFGQPQLRITADREACARYGVDVSDILTIVELAVGGEVVDQIYIDNRRFGVLVRFLEKYRDDPAKIERLLVNTREKGRIPLAEVAEVSRTFGPLQINRENNQRRWIIQGNVRGRDMGGVIEEIQEKIDQRVDLPSGYYLQYGGQFENQQRAMRRLSLIVPVALTLILLMLYLAFGSVKNALLIILSVPLSLIGGVFGLYITGEYLSVPAALGFVALFGIAVQDSMVLVSCINQLCLAGVPVRKAVVEGAHLRVRPVLMTTVTTMLGLLPLLLSRGVGAEVQRPLAVVVVFGLASSTVLTLLVKPILYEWFEKDEYPYDTGEATHAKD